MKTVLIIIAVVAVVFGVGAYVSSEKGDPKERAADAAGAAAGGAIFAGSCLFQLAILGVMALVGLWVLGLIFGR